MTVDWGDGFVDYRDGKVWRFENDGVVWYDAEKGIELAGWQKELEPYEGPGREGHTLIDKTAG